MSGPSHNRLAVLAADIQVAHGEVMRGALAVAERALAAGRMLIEAKEAVPHGEWAKWLSDQVGMSARTGRRYMQLTRAGVESATVAEIGIRGSAEHLARSRIPRPPLGMQACAVFQRETMTIVWRDAEQPDRFHVVTFGRIDGMDHMICATKLSVPDELLSRTVAESGFPVGAAAFYFEPKAERVLELFRQWAHAVPA